MSKPRQFSDERIFKGVYQALSKKGYANLTLAHIAQEIELSPAALSKRFGSKKGLLLAYSDHVIEMTKQTFAEAQSTSGSSLEALKNVFLQSMKTVGDPVSLANITSLYIEGVSDPDLLQRSCLRLQVIDDGVQQLLQSAIRGQEIKACDTALVSRVLQAAIGGSLMLWLKQSERTPDEWIDDCFEVVFASVRLAEE
ncbi:TetR/AcrR family transcriptional regulator [Desmospora activa]|uniref:TetR family transcriptional regulator n=1 Tax=Desmospora activa DSM 45169 TaxID=1121389 RepID=A0A2T4Z8G5_9BACL|nr:TetR/AcrR family transcriptional regulator [Desmospora activa]PTM58191.1 TetR family transcriptional regulator [Desmospora activa DSM 45169]